MRVLLILLKNTVYYEGATFVINLVFDSRLEFKDCTNRVTEYTYDKNGNLTKDLSKNISNIRYILLN